MSNHNGAELIRRERERQKRSERWTQAHDDAHNDYELSEAAICYAEAAYKLEQRHRLNIHTPLRMPGAWPWEAEWWKPGNDPIRALVKAGALIAAEIDRLQRLAAESKGHDGD